MDVLDRSFASGKVEELDGTPVFSLVSGPDRLLGLAAKRLVDILGSAVLLVVLSPVLAVDRARRSACATARRSCSARRGWASTGGRSTS